MKKRCLFLILILNSCAGKVTAPTPTTTEATAPMPSIEVTAEQKEQAARFDRFLNRKLSNAEQTTLKETCAKEPGKNLFCYAVLNLEALEMKQHPKTPRAPRVARVQPRFKGKTIVNWQDLRADSFNHLIKTFARMGSTRLGYVKAAALQETQCPNNAAIAVAASLEDFLPLKVEVGELAELYEKGGDCLTNPDDKENMLTRAGLFHYVKKDSTRAIAVWQRSAAVEAAKSPRPFFWLYRVGTEMGDRAVAQSALSKLTTKFPFAFHTIMARLRENQDPDDILVTRDGNSRTKSQVATDANTLVAMVNVLRASGFNRSASKVLDWAIQDAVTAEPEFRFYLAEIKAELQETHSSIFLLSKVLIDNPQLVSRRSLDLYFPKAYLTLFEKHSERLDPYLLLSIARQESAFDARAVSTARAKGLLQVVSKRARRGGKDLFDPETNIRTGARMFSGMLKQNDGRVHVALSGYNAGPRRAATWVKRYTTTDPILFIDLIPFKETRAYVALILRNYYWYKRLHGPTEERLPWIAKNDSERMLWLGPPSLATKTP